MKKIFVSSQLKIRYPEVFKLLEGLNLKIVNSDNIWLRDFAPIQVNSHFVKFEYDAVGGGEPIDLKLPDTQTSSVWLDGGNLQRIGSNAVITDIVFEHNPEFSQGDLFNRLSEELETNVVIIPNDDDDFYGHSDGIISQGDKCVFISDSATHKKEIIKTLKKLGVEHQFLPCPRDKAPYFDSLCAFGYYINFLAVDGAVYYPTFDIPEDEEAGAIFERHFKTTVPVPCRKLSMQGGCVHCVTADYEAI